MRYCDKCHATYPNDFTVCPRDQTALRITSEFVQGMQLRGKYEILDKIGSGGMASVYKARHLAFNEIRAIKVVSSRLMDDDLFLKRFKNEAIITRKLQHPNAVRVDDLDTTDDGRPFIIMEFVAGRDLREVIEKEGPLLVRRALRIGKQILSALSAAHALGITHRDIKPDNVLLISQPDGTEIAKVLDFGIAKIREGSFESGSSYSATKTGVVVGTPQYLSPEQAMGKHGSEIDGRADIYSVGVVLYEMLTGCLPFESDTPMGILIKHIQSVPRPAHELKPSLEIPKPVSMILMKAMQKDRNDRFQSADEMLEALNAPEQWAATARIGSQSATARDDATAAIGSDFLANLRIAPSRVPTPPPSHVHEPLPPLAPPPQPLRATPPAPVVKPPAPPPPPPAAAPASAAPKPPFQYSPPSSSVEPAPPPHVTAPPPPPARQASRPAHVPPPPRQERRTWLWVGLAVLLTAAVMGGGGYWYLHTQVPVAQPSTAAPAPSPSDASIKADVSAALGASHDFQRVEVAVHDGVVTLSGSVTTPALADQAVRLASARAAVKEVRNQVNFPPVAPSAGEQAAATPSALEETPKPEPKSKPKSAAARETRAEPATPRGPTPQQRRHLRELLADGERLVNSGAYAAAIDAYNQALEIDSHDSAALAGLRRAQQAKATEEEILRKRK
ncbi:MAG: protein kinase [Acidobacteriia bacterium]|nr:protein kinase [Terriglobia bacterium]